MENRPTSRLTREQILAQVPAARQRAENARKIGKSAEGVRYDASQRLLLLTFATKGLVGIPVERVEALRGASAEQLGEAELSPAGNSLHFETLDVDLSIPALLARTFEGTQMVTALSSLAGSKKTERKAIAARQNGAKGGRPKGSRTTRFGFAVLERRTGVDRRGATDPGPGILGRKKSSRGPVKKSGVAKPTSKRGSTETSR